MNFPARIFTVFMACCMGIVARLQFEINPAKYNGMIIDTSAVPAPVEKSDGDYYVQLSEVNMHYAVYGKAEGKKPLVLIHGNGGNLNSLSDAARYLANDYTVYVTESRCHGSSTDTDEITYDLMAKDIKEFIVALGLEKPIVMGHSDGGIVAVSLASEYPDIPGAVISCGANSSPEAAWFQFRFWVRWENLLEKDKLNDLMLDGPYFTEEFLGRITCPVYVVSADHDLMPITDTVYIAEHISDSDYAIIKDSDHGGYLEGKQAYALARAWLDTEGM